VLVWSGLGIGSEVVRMDGREGRLTPEDMFVLVFEEGWSEREEDDWKRNRGKFVPPPVQFAEM